MAEPIAVYVHVPWCRHVCPYCDFNVRARRLPPEREDVATLRREVAAWATDPVWHGRPAKSVYLGGGTPSLLSPDAVADIIGGIRDALGILDDAEVTLEANPGTVDVGRLTGYRAAGVNRLSLGAQSMQAAVLRTLGRDHAPCDTLAAIGAARAAGFDNVSLDLIFAVPGQTIAMLEDDLAQFLALEPRQVSAYALTWEEATPFHRWRQRGRLCPVDEDVEATMGDVVAARLEAAGLLRYEISSWARPGYASRHNVAYWDGSDYLGLGPGAHGFSSTPAPGRRWSNVRSPVAHRAAVAAHGTAVGEDEMLPVERARADFVWTGLRRVRDGVDVPGFAARFGLSLREALPAVVALERDGLLHESAGRLVLTRRGLRFADSVSAALL